MSILLPVRLKCPSWLFCMSAIRLTSVRALLVAPPLIATVCADPDLLEPRTLAWVPDLRPEVDDLSLSDVHVLGGRDGGRAVVVSGEVEDVECELGR